MHSCKETIDRLYSYLDRELSLEEQREVQEHLDACPPCRDLFHFEENVLTLVRASCRQTLAPPALRERVQRLAQHP